MGTKQKEAIILTITLLMSNRPDTIDKCLASLQPLMDAVPSELIIVDTARDQKCLEIAKKYTTKIVPFIWCDDFAAARNAGLSKAKGLWSMFIDDDEWFEDTTELQEFFLQDKYKKYESAAYITRNYTDYSGKSYYERTAVRLCKMRPDTQFIGRIHEQLFPLYEPTYYTQAYVHHYGYVFLTEEQEKQHAWRNIGLLLNARKLEKDNWMAGAHLIQEYYAVKEFFSLIDIAKEMRSHKDSYDMGRGDFTAYADIMEMRAYLELKSFDVAYPIGKELLATSEMVLIGKICITGMMAEICLKRGSTQEVLEYCKQFWKYHEEWEKDLDKNVARDSFGIREKFLCEEYFAKLHMIELHAYVEEKDWDNASDAFSAIHWDVIQSTLSNTFDDTLALVANTEYADVYAQALEVLIKGKGSREYLQRQISLQDNGTKMKVLHAISQIVSTDTYIQQYKLQYAILCEDREKLLTLLNQWSDLNYSFFFPDKQFWEGLEKLHIGLRPWLEKVRIQEWIQLTEALFEQFEEKDCENVYQVLTRDLPQTDIRFLHITALRLEKHLLSRNMKLENIGYIESEEVWKELYRIAQLWVSCAAMLYREDVFRGELQSALPGCYQFSWHIFQANAVKADSILFVRKIGEAAKCYLKMEDVCKYMLRCYKCER